MEQELALTFPLVPSRRFLGASFGGFPGARRGGGSDVAGSRRYEPGDDIGSIDWRSTAKLSSATSSDTFVVREFFDDESPEVLVVYDRRPSMDLYPAGSPWLSKAAAERFAAMMIASSARVERGIVGYLDYADAAPIGSAVPTAPNWIPPRGLGALLHGDPWDEVGEYLAPEHSLELAIDYLVAAPRTLPRGSFVFVLSDFLAPPAAASWLALAERAWDIVPVVIQDPLWEQSFPQLPSVVVPIADPTDGSVRSVRISGRDARARRHTNEARLAALLDELADLDLDAVLIGDDDPIAIHAEFEAWADRRLARLVQAL
ncbi:MAG: hypothetical protein QOF43_1172 [Gaiellaceae bacterium]|nr:hypothetical protein [Gaiellaceae bacterium]